jgi:hypothetical protein
MTFGDLIVPNPHEFDYWKPVCIWHFSLHGPIEYFEGEQRVGF